MLKQVLTFKEAHDKWAAAGHPRRSPDLIAETFAICEQCPAFLRVAKDLGRCNDCGCWLKRSGTFFNKIAWTTEVCPRGFWPAQPSQPSQPSDNADTPPHKPASDTEERPCNHKA